MPCVPRCATAERHALDQRACALRLITDARGRRLEAVEVERDGRTVRVEAPLFIVSCGAVNSAALLLRSANDRHPAGLANSSGLVGRRYMAHLATMMQGFHPFRPNATVFQKTVAINDFYLRGPALPLSARPDPVAGADARRHGPDCLPRHPAVGLRSLGGARRGLAGDVGGSAAARQPRDRGARRTHPSALSSEQSPVASRAGRRRRSASCAGSVSG